MTNEVTTIGLGMETDGVERGIKSLKTLAEQGPRVEKAMTGVEGASSKAARSLKSLAEESGKGLEGISKSSPKAAEGVGRVAKSADDAKKALAAINASASGFGNISISSAKAAADMLSFSSGVKSAQQMLREMQAQVAATNQSMAQMGGLFSSSVPTLQSVIKAQTEAAKQAASMGHALKEAEDRVRSYATAANNSAVTTAKSFEATAIAVRTLNAALAAAGIGFGVNELLAMVDGYTKFTAQLKLATSSVNNYGLAMESVKRIATDAQQGLGEVGTLYARIANGTAELNLSQRKLSDITETVALSLKVSGAAASESASAMLQLSQAFASGVFRGEEFNSVNEAAPRLMKALADGIGVTVGALRKMAAEGQLTSSVLADALPKALGKLREEAKSVLTISGSFTVLKNNLMEMVGAQSNASGITKGLSTSINALANNLDILATAGSAVALVMGSRVAVSAATATAAFVAEQAAVVRLGAAISGTSAVSVAGLTAMATASRAAAASLAFLSGPWGAALLLAGGAAAAFYSFSDSSKELLQSIGGLNQPLDELKKRLDALPAEKQISVKIAIQEEQKNSVKQAKDELEDLIQSVAGMTSIRMPADQFDNLISGLREAGKEGGNLAPVLEEAARAGNISPAILQKWLEMASRLRDAQAAASGAAAALGGASASTAIPLVFAENHVLLQSARAALEASKGFKSQAEQMADVRKQAKGVSDELKKLQDAGLGASKEATELTARLTGFDERLKSLSKRNQEGASAAKAAEHSYQGLLKSVNEHIAAVQLQMNGSTKLTESQKLQVKYDELLMHGKKGASAATIAMVQARISALAALEREQKAIRLNVAAYQDYVTQQQELADDYVKQSKAREMVWKSISAGNVALDDQEKRLSIEEQMIGRSSAARTIALAQLEAEIELRKELSEIDSNLDIDEPTRIEARAAARARSARKIALAERKAYVTEWEKTSQLVGQTLADYIMGGGKDAAQYLKRLFATLVLQPVVQYGVSGVMGAMGFGGQSAAGGSAASNTLGLLQSGQGLWSAFSGGTAGTLASGVVGLGQLMGSSFLGELGAGIAAGGQLGIGGTASLIGSAGGTTGAGMAIGAALPWVAGGLAIASLLGGVSFGSRGANHSGGAYSTRGNGVYDLGLRGDALGDFTSRGNAEIASSVQGLVQSTVSAFDYLGKYANDTFKGVDIAAGFAVNGRFSDEDAYAYFRLIDKATGGLLQSYTQRDGGLGSDANAAWATFSKDLLTSVYGQFMKSDITGWVRDEMAAIDGQVTFENLAAAAQKIAAIDAAFVSFGKTIDGMADLAGSVQTTLIRTSGGFDALSANLGSYYAGYYSAAEQLDDQVASLTDVFSAYGATLPTTREQFRALVEQQLAAGDAGAEFAAVLLGLNTQFGSVADAWAKDLSSMSASVSDFFSDLMASIDALSADVESSRKDILRGTDVMSADSIRAAILAAGGVSAPSLLGVSASQSAVSAAAQDVARKQAAYDAKNSVYQSAQWSTEGLTAKRDALASEYSSRNSAYEKLRGEVVYASETGYGNYNYRYELGQRWLKMQAEWSVAAPTLQAQIEALNRQIAAQAGSLGVVSEAASAAAKQLAEAKAALAAAQKSEEKAKVDYAAQVARFVTDAGNSVSKLSDLRGEVVSFYEAQAQAVQAMLQSAGNIRGVVDQLRLGQLTTAQTAAELGNRYAVDYAMALATTGSTRAGYVDAMAGNLGGLTEALKAESVTGTDWRIETAKLFAQASNAAGLLQGDAESDDYKDVALGLLDSIDAALAGLSGSTKSAEQVIADAINSGTQSQLEGLRAIVAALQGKSVPAFASGGMHLGGLRIVGENGPELEATGPSRIWNQSQLSGALGSRGSSARTEQLLQQLIEEQRVQASRQVDLQLQLNKQMQRWDAMGMPETREVSA